MLKQNDLVLISYYSSTKVLKSFVMHQNDNVLTVQAKQDLSYSNLNIGEPVVIAFLDAGKLKIVGCEISALYEASSLINLKIDTEPENSSNEKIAVSLYAEIKSTTSNKKYKALVKNIAYYEMTILTELELKENVMQEMDIYFDRTVIPIKASVVTRNTVDSKLIRYDLRIIYETNSTLVNMREYIKTLKSIQEATLSKL